MARWRLLQPHYLNVPNTKYRYEETDRQTGERNEQSFEVPRFIDPNAPKDCRSNGECVVSYADGAQRGDWVFAGEPTPDMEPLDEAAKELSESLSSKWSHPINDIPLQGGFSEQLFQNLEKQLTNVFKNASEVVGGNVSLKGVPVDEFRALQEQVAALMARNAELEAKTAPKTAVGGRRG